MNDATRTGPAFRETRRLLGLRQQDVAQLAGIMRPELSRIESGQRRLRPEVATRLARALAELAEADARKTRPRGKR